jgi:hypothetical protein
MLVEECCGISETLTKWWGVGGWGTVEIFLIFEIPREKCDVHRNTCYHLTWINFYGFYFIQFDSAYY